jgi:hypothetical protein
LEEEEKLMARERNCWAECCQEVPKIVRIKRILREVVDPHPRPDIELGGAVERHVGGVFGRSSTKRASSGGVRVAETSVGFSPCRPSSVEKAVPGTAGKRRDLVVPEQSPRRGTDERGAEREMVIALKVGKSVPAAIGRELGAQAP